MAEKPSTEQHAELRAFVEAALTDPTHPIYGIGYAKSAALQHYAVNVLMLESVKPEKWFTDYPAWTARLEEAKKLLEAKPVPVPVAEAAPMLVKCPECGKEFSVNPAAAKGD